jgi:hypothetical protein
MKFRQLQRLKTGHIIGGVYEGAEDYAGYHWKVLKNQSKAIKGVTIWCLVIKITSNNWFTVGGFANVTLKHISLKLVRV